MTNGITLSQLNEALSRQTVMLLDRVNEMIDEKLEEKLEEKLDRMLDEKLTPRFEAFANSINEDFSNQLIDMMTHIDNRFDALEQILNTTVVRVDDHELRIQTLEHYGNVNSISSPI